MLAVGRGATAMTTALPGLTPRTEITRRLALIFPEGTPLRRRVTSPVATATVYVALYIGAVEGTGNLLAPKHVYRMSDQQAALHEQAARDAYRSAVLAPGYKPGVSRWYEDNSREGIRDDTIREGFLQLGVMTAIELPTTSAKPRYALTAPFAALFSPGLDEVRFLEAARKFRETALSKGALARIQLRQALGTDNDIGVPVRFPGGEVRQMAPGPSSLISKAVIEEFAPRFLSQPAVIWLSESGNKVVSRDDAITQAIGLTLRTEKDLPDIILADLEPAEPLLVFVEVVASDGPFNERRKGTLLQQALADGFQPERLLFVSAFADRSHQAFRRLVGDIAWGSIVWFAAEPGHVVLLSGGRSQALSDLGMGLGGLLAGPPGGSGD
jgi:hypothetical protein